MKYPVFVNVGEAHQCKLSKNNMHLIFGIPEGYEGYIQSISCKFHLIQKRFVFNFNLIYNPSFSSEFLFVKTFEMTGVRTNIQNLPSYKI